MNIINLFEEIVVDDTYDSDYTIDEAAELIADAKARGWNIPNELTPELYIKMYNSHKRVKTYDDIMFICKQRAEDCITDIDGLEGARQYLHDIKMSGYSVPKMLTPELFLKLYNEYNEED